MAVVREKQVVVDIQFLLGVLLLKGTRLDLINVLINLSYVAENKG
jgi:hypothetical protein